MKRLYCISVLAGIVLVSGEVRAKDIIHSIEVEGNRRVETPTILSYLDVKLGEIVTEENIEEILKNLFSTGLFADVVIEQVGDRLVIKVVENKIINLIAFEGNDRLKDEVLKSEIGLRPREVYTPARAQEAAQKIRDMYRLSGRYGAKVVPKIVEREQSRIDLIFEIDEGKPTKINKIMFVGNEHFSSSRLSSVVLTQETHWYSFFSSDDTYDPDRLNFDKELLRRYYREQGYADFKVDSVVAELDPDEQEFYITYTLDEGKRFRFGEVKVSIELPKLKMDDLNEIITIQKGEWFNSKQIEKSVEKLVYLIGEKGFAFIEIEPVFKRNPETCTIDVDFVIKEGRHVYINRINIIGNDRTDDEVIRREFRLAEGDAYNSEKLKRSEQRLQNLDYFKKVDIKQEETAASDKIDLKVEVEDKPTGSLQFSAGYSTVDSIIGSVTMNERNLMGKGYDLYGSAMVSMRAMDFHTGFQNPYMFGKPLSGTVDVFHSSRKYSTRGNPNQTGFRQTKTGSSFALGYELMERLGQSWSYTVRRDYINDIPRNASPFLQKQRGEWYVSSFGQNLFYDNRDNSVEPTSGYFAAIANDLAGAGGDVKFFKNAARIGCYIPVDDDHSWVIATKGSAGVMVGLGQVTRVVDRYELGGDSMRGFGESGIGPRDSVTRDALGGLYYYKGTVELTFPLGLPKELGIKGNVFTDIGSVWHTGSKSSVTVNGVNHRIVGNTPQARIGVGAGATWRSPFGLIGVSYTPWSKGIKHVDRFKQFNVSFGSSF